MSAIVVDREKCVGCGLCVKACAQNAIHLVDKKAVVDAGCIACGMCLDSCRKGALSRAAEHAGEDVLSQYRDVWVYAETSGDKILPVAYELLGAGRRLADALGVDLCAVLCGGEGLTSATRTLVEAGADHVYACLHPMYTRSDELLYADRICGLIREKKPEIVLYGATGFGRSLAPRIAARLRTGLTADCTVLDIDPETRLLRQTRPAFGGNLMATIICPSARPQMATVRPGIMQAELAAPGRAGTVHYLDAPAGTGNSPITVQEVLSRAQRDAFGDAEIIVSAGRGIGKQKNLQLVKRLAELLGAQYGVSRPLIDMGWCEYSHQIGQTGHSVAPKVLLMFGISGAIQHLAGIMNAGTVIAVNSDPDAPIFRVATYGIVDDAVSVLKEMIQTLESQPPGVS